MPDHPLLVGGDHDYPPYEFLDAHGEPSGFNVDLIRAIARVEGIEVSIHLTSWTDARKALEEGRVHALLGMFISPERDKQVDFTPAHTLVHHAIFAREDAPEVLEVADLRGRALIVQAGDIMHEFVLEQGLSPAPKLVKTPSEALRLLHQGGYDYALLSQPQGRYLSRQLGLRGITTTGPLLRASRYAFAVRKGDSALRQSLSEGLLKIKQTGEYRAIYDHWIGAEMDPRLANREALRMAGMIIVPLLALLAVSLFWTRALRRRVAERTAELRHREDYLAGILRASPAGIGVVRDRVFQSVNPRFCQMTGYPEAELVGQTSRAIYPTEAEFQRVGKEKYTQIRRTGVGTVETRFRRKDGHEIDVLLSSSFLNPEDPNAGTAFCAFDISAAKESERDLVLYKEIVSATDDWLAFVDQDLQYLAANSAYLRARGLCAARLPQLHVSETLGGEVYAQVRPHLEQALAGNKAHFQSWFANQDGERRFMDVHYYPHRTMDAAVSGVVIGLRDITDSKLAQDELRLRSDALEYSLNGFDMIDAQGRFVYANQAYLTMWGYRDLNEIVGSSPDDHCADAQVPGQIIANLNSNGEDVREFTARRRDGSSFQALMFSRRYVGTDGEVYYMGTSLDITERKRDELKLRRQTRALQVLSAVRKAAARAENEKTMLQAACRILVTLGGYRSAWIGLPLRDVEKTFRAIAQHGFEHGFLESLTLHWSEHPAHWESTGRAIIEGRTVASEGNPTLSRNPAWRRHTERNGYRSSCAVPLKQPQGPPHVLTVYAAEADAFDNDAQTLLEQLAEDLVFNQHALRIRAERAMALSNLRAAHATLEQRVSERTAELAAANTRLRELDQLKSMFIASMSHELRTPLNSIIGFTGVLLQGMSGELSHQQRDQLQRVYGAGKHLLALITDVIDVSKIEAGKVEVRPSRFDLGPVLEEALATLRPEIEAKKLSLASRIPTDVSLVSDRRRLLQCLLNLLSNAMKYTESGGIELSAARTGQGVRIEVSDTGIGISATEQSQLFKPFVRLDSHLRLKTRGTGLGLYLTHKILHLIGGRIELHSTKGQGTRIAIDLPLEWCGQGEPPQ